MTKSSPKRLGSVTVLVALVVVGAVTGVAAATGASTGASDGAAIDYGMDVSGTLTTGDRYVDQFGYHENYTFYGERGDNVTAALRQTVGEDEVPAETRLWLVAPSGEIEASETLDLEYDPYRNISVDTTLDETGTYTLVVGAAGDAPNFDYRLRLRERLATADPVAYGDRISDAVTTSDAFSDGTLNGGDDLPRLDGYHDVYAFEGTEGDNVTAELRQTLGTDETPEPLVLKMIAPSGEVETVEQLDLEYDAYRNISVDTSLDETGTYKLVVTGATVTDTFDYQLRLHRSLATSDSLAYGDRVDGTVTKTDALSVYSGTDRDDIPPLEGYHDIYTFEGAVGDNVTAELRQTLGTDEAAEPIMLKLVAPDGGVETVAQHDLEYDPNQNISVDTSLDANGTYRLVVTSAVVTDTFDYQLRLHRPFAPNETIAYGDRVDGSVTKTDAFSVYSGSDRDDITPLEGYHDVYTFEGQVGDNVTAELRQTLGTDEAAEPIMLKLVAPDGGVETVARHDLEYDPNQNISVDTSLDANGTYKLVVTSAVVTDTFDYQLRLHRSLATSDSVAYGDRVDGAVTKTDAFSVYSGSDRDDIAPLEGYHDIYTFEGTVGDNVTAELRQTLGTDEAAEPIILKLVAPDGGVETVQQHDLEYDPNQNISVDASLDETGTYRLVVTSARVTDTFDYRLRFRERLATNETLAYGDRVTGAVTKTDAFSDGDGTDAGLPILDGYHDVYAVEGTADDEVTAVLNQTGGGSDEAILLKLIAPSGDLEDVEQYDLQYDSENSVSVDTALDETGTYKLVVEGAELTDTFEYALNVTGPAPEPTTPPDAALSVSPATATVGESVTFDAGASTDPDGSVVEYAWDFDGDGTVDRTTTTATTTYGYGASGDYVPSVTVTDDDGLTNETTAAVSVVADTSSPSVSVRLTPADGSTAPDEATTYDVVVANVSNGVGSAEFTVDVGNASVATITGVDAADGFADTLSNVTVTDGGAGASVQVAAGDTDDTGSVTVATLTVTGRATGTTGLDLSVRSVGGENATSYVVSSTANATVTVETGGGVVVVGDQPTTDGDGPFAGDGLHQDVNGDGRVTLADITGFFANVRSEAVGSNAALFDFNGDGTITFADVTALFNAVSG